MKVIRNFSMTLAVCAALGTGVLAPAQAQRNPAYAAARAAGQIGERVDGYLGIVGAATPKLQRIVDDINIKRRTIYAKKAQENNATVEQYAITVGCQAIARTAVGEMYQAPDGSWKKRTSQEPERDPRCP